MEKDLKKFAEINSDFRLKFFFIYYVNIYSTSVYTKTLEYDTQVTSVNLKATKRQIRNYSTWIICTKQFSTMFQIKK